MGIAVALPAKAFAAITDEVMIAIILMNKDNRCLYINPLAKSLLEIPDDYSLENFNIKDLFPEAAPDRKVKPFDDTIYNGQGYYQDVLVKKFNKQNFYASVGVKVFSVSNTTCRLITIQDVTLQKKLQREITEKQSAIHQAFQDLLRQNQQLKDLDVAKNKFIAVTTHELRTPLSAVVASAEIIKLKLYDSDAQREEFTNMIYEQGLHLLSLVNDILDFAKIQANKMDYYVEQKDLFELAKVQLVGLETMASSAQVNLYINKPDFSCLCYFDEMRMKQIIINITNNAIKYNRGGGSVTLDFKQSNEQIELHITDTGNGISEENQGKVFNEFETLGKASNHSKGTGLGLSISQRMIRAMGGDVHLKSEVGVGSTFWITVPITKVLSEDNYRSRPDSGGDMAA